MPARKYDPFSFSGLVRGHAFKRLMGLPPVGVRGSESFLCADSRAFFGSSLCRPGHFFDASLFGPWTVQDMILHDFWDVGYNRDGGIYVYPGTWQDYSDGVQAEWVANGFDGSWLDGALAPGVTLDVEPTMAHLDPPPDYALCIAYAPPTFWFGYTTGCDVAGKGCGSLQFNQPYVELNAFGTGPYVDARLDYSPMSLSGGFVNGNPGPSAAFGTDAGEDPDPMIVNPGGWAYTDFDHPDALVPPPLPANYNLYGRGVAMGGTLRPPVPGYTPNANSSNPGEATDALNTGSKELWKWDDVKTLAAQFSYGTGGQWYKVGWGSTTSGFGEAYLIVHPYWLVAPPEEPVLHGRIDAAPVASAIRKIRGGRVVNDGAVVEP